MEELKALSVKQNLWPVVKCNLKHTFIGPLGLSVLLLLITPLIFGVENLDAAGSAAPLEMFVALCGIILLTPVFMPEQKPETLDLVAAKWVSCMVVWGLRLLYSVVALALLTGLFCLSMRLGHCDVSFGMFLGCVCGALFLGASGLLASAVFNNVAVSYMVPLIVYAANFSGPKLLGNFWLFSMTVEQYHQKVWLFVSALVMLAAAFVIKGLRRRMA